MIASFSKITNACVVHFNEYDSISLRHLNCFHGFSECVVSYLLIVEVDFKLCLLEKQQKNELFFNMEKRVHPLFKTSMTWESLLYLHNR